MLTMNIILLYPVKSIMNVGNFHCYCPVSVREAVSLIYTDE